MKIYTRKRDLYKQIKLAKILEFKLKTERNFKATTNFFNFLSFKKKKKKEKKRKAAINLQNFIFITLQKNMIIQ